MTWNSLSAVCSSPAFSIQQNPERIHRPWNIRKNTQTLEYQKECTDPGISERSQTLEYQKECTHPEISERMHRPWNIRKNSQTLEYQKECTDPGISERIQTLEYQKECTDPGISSYMNWDIYVFRIQCLNLNLFIHKLQKYLSCQVI